MAREHLRRQSFRTLYPTERRKRLVRRALVEFESPLFPGYFFVTFNVECDRWQSINSTRGVKRLMCTGDATPLPLSRRAVDTIISQCAEPIAAHSGYEAGGRVRIVEGPFTDHVGICTRVERDRVRLLLMLLGRVQEILVPVAAALPLEGAA